MDEPKRYEYALSGGIPTRQEARTSGSYLTVVPGEADQRAAYTSELEEKVKKAIETMREAIETDDDAKFEKAAAIIGQSQEMWLIIARRMTSEQARSTMVDFAENELTRWVEDRRPGPPLLIFDSYTS